MLSVCAIFYSCTNEEDYDNDNLLTVQSVINEFKKVGYKEIDIRDIPEGEDIIKFKNLKDAMIYLEESQINPYNTTVNSFELLDRVKTRSEGGGGTIIKRYGVKIVEEKTTLTHTISFSFIEKGSDYTIEGESLSYDISGWTGGNISTSTSNLSKNSSTKSAFQTKAVHTLDIYGVILREETVEYRWDITFKGGSDFSFSATNI